MTFNVRAALGRHCKGRPCGALAFEHEAKPGERICGTSLYRRFVYASKPAELPPQRIDDLRNGSGTQAIRVFTIYEVQQTMGHGHITTAER
jgi:hypothetical protein